MVVVVVMHGLGHNRSKEVSWGWGREAHGKVLS
jgi:hypothetical protein